MKIISNGIRELLLLFLKNQIVFQSWGCSNLSVSYDRIRFFVNALKYKGFIVIIDKGIDNMFEVQFSGMETVKLDINSIISFIDVNIETGNNYYNKLLSRIVNTEI